MKNKKKTLLWKITGKELSGDSFLFGTMHLRDSTAFAHIDLAKKAIQETTVFATEFDLGDADPAVFQQALMLPEGQTLSGLLSRSLYARLKKCLQKLGGEELLLADTLKPYFFTNFISERMMSEDNSQPLDAALWEYALSEGKIMKGVETFEEQVAIMYAIPLDYQVKTLKDTILNMSKFKKHLRQTTRLYEEAALDKLHKAAKKSVKGIRKLMLTDRNHIMADRIHDMTKQSTATFAVGAGHLMGKNGLIRLLKNKGLSVKPA